MCRPGQPAQGKTMSIFLNQKFSSKVCKKLKSAKNIVLLFYIYLILIWYGFVNKKLTCTKVRLGKGVCWNIGCVFVFFYHGRGDLFTYLLNLIFPQSGCANVVGELDHGHARFAGPGHGNADPRLAAAKTLRTNETTHFTNNDEKHFGTGCLPANCHFHPAVLRYGTIFQFPIWC